VAAAVGEDGLGCSAERRAAVGLLAFAEFATSAGPLEVLLTPQTQLALQSAAVAALAQHGDAKVAELLLAPWRSYSPKVRGEAVDALLGRTARIAALLAAVESGDVRHSEIDREKKQLLMNHPNDRVRADSRKLFGGEVAGDRAKVLAEYQQVLDLDGDAARGRAGLTKPCAACHRVGDEGHAVGPDLASVQNKSPADLLVDILDPNRDAQSNYTTYTVITHQGNVLTGIIAEETAGSLTLQRAEGKEAVVLRSEIETLASTGLSLMPEGLEKDISPQQMADVIEFVRTLSPPE
jgi:putative heme-binding domain-containing protein